MVNQQWPIWMAPLTRSRAMQPGNIPTEMHAEYYAQRAHPEDGAIAIISEATPVCPEGHGYFATPGIYTEEQVDGWKKTTRAVHEVGGKIYCQVWHVGRVSHVSLQPNGNAPVSSTTTLGGGKTYIDAKGTRVKTSAPRALETAEVHDVIEKFRIAAGRCMKAGFDGVEIHGANGYLLEQFLRSGINDRSDEFGGSLENRLKVCLEIAKSISSEIGADRTGYRISPISGELEGGRFDENMEETYASLAIGLADLDIAFIDVVESFSVGVREEGLDAICARIRKAFPGGDSKLYLAGGGYTRESARAALDSKRCDGVIFGRDFISNPDLQKRLRENLPLTPWERRSFYLGGAEGYVDWPTFEDESEGA
ncbi:MAG: alkene reductase [Planctomycetia bacterium]|nr:alkene reductase [Planctomycetia bacterium]